MFIRLYEQAKSINDTEMMSFYSQVLEVYENNNKKGHIE